MVKHEEEYRQSNKRVQYNASDYTNIMNRGCFCQFLFVPFPLDMLGNNICSRKTLTGGSISSSSALKELHAIAVAWAVGA